jgi:hypothetical protein
LPQKPTTCRKHGGAAGRKETGPPLHLNGVGQCFSGRPSQARPLRSRPGCEQELKRAQIAFHKTDNAFLAVDNVTALQAAADRLSPAIIRQRLNYWTLILGPKFSAKERKQLNLSRFYAIAQIEYCRNFIFKRNFPIHKLFERSCELGLWRLTALARRKLLPSTICFPGLRLIGFPSRTRASVRPA